MYFSNAQGNAVSGMQKCGLCMEFGPQGARKTDFSSKINEKCDVSCEAGRPTCRFHPLER